MNYLLIGYYHLLRLLKHYYYSYKYPTYNGQGGVKYAKVYTGNDLVFIPYKLNMVNPYLKYVDENDKDITKQVVPFVKCKIVEPKPEWFGVKKLNKKIE